VYGVPSGRFQRISPVSRLESCQLVAFTGCPGSSTRGTSQPSSFLPMTSMFCE
jgi:hypothetical protein